MIQPNTIAICLYGKDNTHSEEIKQLCLYKFNLIDFKRYHIEFYEHYDSNDLYKSLWLSCMKKRDAEFTERHDFSICMAIDVSDESSMDLLNRLSNKQLLYPGKIKKLDLVSLNTMFYITGEKDRITLPDLNIFYADSFIFDRICEFGINREMMPYPGELHEKQILVLFYYYLKSLKIKLECINYENSSLFKRTA